VESKLKQELEEQRLRMLAEQEKELERLEKESAESSAKREQEARVALEEETRKAHEAEQAALQALDLERQALKAAEEARRNEEVQHAMEMEEAERARIATELLLRRRAEESRYALKNSAGSKVGFDDEEGEEEADNVAIADVDNASDDEWGGDADESPSKDMSGDGTVTPKKGGRAGVMLMIQRFNTMQPEGASKDANLTPSRSILAGAAARQGNRRKSRLLSKEEVTEMDLGFEDHDEEAEIPVVDVVDGPGPPRDLPGATSPVSSGSLLLNKHSLASPSGSGILLPPGRGVGGAATAGSPGGSMTFRSKRILQEAQKKLQADPQDGGASEEQLPGRRSPVGSGMERKMSVRNEGYRRGAATAPLPPQNYPTIAPKSAH